MLMWEDDQEEIINDLFGAPHGLQLPSLTWVYIMILLTAIPHLHAKKCHPFTKLWSLLQAMLKL